jgi:hypothetical protein
MTQCPTNDLIEQPNINKITRRNAGQKPHKEKRPLFVVPSTAFRGVNKGSVIPVANNGQDEAVKLKQHYFADYDNIEFRHYPDYRNGFLQRPLAATCLFLVSAKPCRFKNTSMRKLGRRLQGENSTIFLEKESLLIWMHILPPLKHLRMGYSILKSAGIIPEEMELLKEIEGLKKSLDSSTTPIERKALRQQLSEKLTNINMRIEHNRKARQA